MLMAQENFGSSSLRFKLDDADQRLAYDMLSKIQRKQTGFITALICEYLEKHNINPYMYESKDLNNIVNAYMNVRKKSNAVSAYPFPAPTAEPATVVEQKPKKKTVRKKQEEIPIEPIEENDKEEVVEQMIVEEPIEEDFSSPMDEVISQADLMNAMQSLNNFY